MHIPAKQTPRAFSDKSTKEGQRKSVLGKRRRSVGVQAMRRVPDNLSWELDVRQRCRASEGCVSELVELRASLHEGMPAEASKTRVEAA